MLPLLANVITADMSFLPGMSLFTPVFGVPLSIVAAVIERPIYSLNGAGRNALWHSIRANCLSLLVGYFFLFVSFGFVRGFATCFWPIGAVFLSAWIERWYLSQAVHKPFGYWSVFGANVVSAICCCCIAFPLRMVDRPQWRVAVQPYETTLSWGLAFVCVVIVLIALAAPCFRPDLRDTTDLTP